MMERIANAARNLSLHCKLNNLHYSFYTRQFDNSAYLAWHYCVYVTARLTLEAMTAPSPFSDLLIR